MNPLITKGIRENLRTKHLIAAGLFSLIVCSTFYMTAFLQGSEGKYSVNPETNEWVKEESSPVNGARNAFTFLLALQGFYLMFLGTGRVASITAEERESGLLDYQRMTPMNPFSKIVGYIFGIPAREYYMFLFTLPFLAHAMFVGKLPWGNILHLYAVFFCSVILYHLTAHTVGLVVPKPRAASWVSRIVVLGLYVVLPGLGQAGISFLSFLTILPTYFGKIFPLLSDQGGQNVGRLESKLVDFWQDVPFFDFTISPTTFTFLMQGLLILTLLVTGYRKWRNQALPALSKTSALFIYSIFQFLLLGCLWTFFDKGEASGLIGQELSAHEFSGKQEKILGLILVIGIFFSLSLLFILCLINICCPNRHLYLKGIQRIAKFNLARIPRIADESSGLVLMLILGVITLFTYSVLIKLALHSDAWVLSSSFLSLCLIPAAVLILAIIYLQASREQWFNLGFWGFVGLLWITPLLASLVLGVGWGEENVGLILKLLAINPLSIIPMHWMYEHSEIVKLPQEIAQNVNSAIQFGLLIAGIFAILLQTRLYFSRKK
ncbi:MAG: hypothetical protein P8O23_06160 [Opitutales bacterium]|nr:hypothetical protein [Opitutales bacterium]